MHLKALVPENHILFHHVALDLTIREKKIKKPISGYSETDFVYKLVSVMKYARKFFYSCRKKFCNVTLHPMVVRKILSTCGIFFAIMTVKNFEAEK